MPLLFGLDGGGTGCRAVVTDLDGRVLGRAEGGPANIATDLRGATGRIIECAERAFRIAAGADYMAGMRSARAGLGLAGANAAGAVAWVAERLPFRTVRIETDAVAAARGALGNRDGVLAALGTGSVFVRQRAGAMQVFGGWGFVLGDEGSGARLGRAALARSLMMVEGRMAPSAFLSGLLETYGGPEGVVAFSLSATPADFATLAPQIITSDDPACRALWQDSLSDVVQVLSHLSPGPDCPVTFAGGLGPATAAALPHVPQRAAFGTALDGAIALAKETMA